MTENPVTHQCGAKLNVQVHEDLHDQCPGRPAGSWEMALLQVRSALGLCCQVLVTGKLRGLLL